MTIRLRDAVESDLAALFALDRICFPIGIAYSLREFRSLLHSASTVGVVAEQEGLLAGFVVAQRVRARRTHGGHIVTIDVAPEFRRRGVGRLLMGYVETCMRRESASWLRLEAAVDNGAAISFYRELGFAELGRIRGYYQGGIDGMVMEKSLAEAAL